MPFISKTTIEKGTEVYYNGKKYKLVTPVFANIPQHYITIENNTGIQSVKADLIEFSDPDTINSTVHVKFILVSGSDHGHGAAVYARATTSYDSTDSMRVFGRNTGNLVIYKDKTFAGVVRFNAVPNGRPGFSQVAAAHGEELDMPKVINVAFDSGNNIVDVRMHRSIGGFKKKKNRRGSNKVEYKRTSVVHKCNDGVQRTVYVSSATKNRYVKKRSAKTGKFYYSKI